MTSKATAKRALKKNVVIFIISLVATTVFCSVLSGIHASAAPAISVDFNTSNNAGGSLGTLEILFLMVLLALGPSIVLMMTSFTRIIIVLSFLRTALGTQQSPPNQILIGLALFLTLFIMQPVILEINDTAYKPFKAGQITQEQALKIAEKPLKSFMLRQTQKKDLQLFMSISKPTASKSELSDDVKDLETLPLQVVIPSFMTSELKRAFTIGFLLFLPFLIIDLVVSSTLMSMGMVMLPPATIALPFKIMMFILVDGWGLLLGTLVKSFR